MPPSLVRQFDTGATRDVDDGKPDYEGFLSPSVIKAFGEYMHRHRIQPDGKLRDSDNWQKGIPLDAYMKSMWRHFHDLWTIHRGGVATDHKGNVVNIRDALGAMLFNVQGYFHEWLKEDARASARDALIGTGWGEGEKMKRTYDALMAKDEAWWDALDGGESGPEGDFNCGDCDGPEFCLCNTDPQPISDPPPTYPRIVPENDFSQPRFVAADWELM